MIYNDVGICNLALTRCGAAVSISSMSEESKQAKICERFYDLSRDSTLEDYDWSFARVRKQLTESTTEFDGWDYVYNYPSNCISMRYLYNAAGPFQLVPQSPILFDILTDEDTNQKFIVSNEYQAVGVYTRKVENTNLFTPFFVQALSYRLAAELALNLLISQSKHDSLMSMYMAMLSKGKSSSAREIPKTVVRNNPIIDARN